MAFHEPCRGYCSKRMLLGIRRVAHTSRRFLSGCMRPGCKIMFGLKHYSGLNHLHYLTTRIYHRARLLDPERFRKQAVATFGELIRN
jgi:hypothetical protein